MIPDVYDFEISELSLYSYVLVHQAWLAISKLGEHRLAKVGLTAETLTILWAIRDYHNKLNPAELARLSHRDKQTISGLLDRMERTGLISRTRKGKGQPTTRIEITAKGCEMCDAGIPVFKSILQDIFPPVSMEGQRQLQKLCKAIRNNALSQLHREIGAPSNDIIPRSISIEW